MCAVSVIYQAGGMNQDVEATGQADEGGMCAWYWNFPLDAHPGTGNIRVSVSLDNQKSSRYVPFVVQ